MSGRWYTLQYYASFALFAYLITLKMYQDMHVHVVYIYKIHLTEMTVSYFSINTHTEPTSYYYLTEYSTRKLLTANKNFYVFDLRTYGLFFHSVKFYGTFISSRLVLWVGIILRWLTSFQLCNIKVVTLVWNMLIHCMLITIMSWRNSCPHNVQQFFYYTFGIFQQTSAYTKMFQDRRLLHIYNIHLTSITVGYFSINTHTEPTSFTSEASDQSVNKVPLNGLLMT